MRTRAARILGVIAVEAEHTEARRVVHHSELAIEGMAALIDAEQRPAMIRAAAVRMRDCQEGVLGFSAAGTSSTVSRHDFMPQFPDVVLMVEPLAFCFRSIRRRGRAASGEKRRTLVRADAKELFGAIAVPTKHLNSSGIPLAAEHSVEASSVVSGGRAAMQSPIVGDVVQGQKGEFPSSTTRTDCAVALNCLTPKLGAVTVVGRSLDWPAMFAPAVCVGLHPIPTGRAALVRWLGRMDAAFNAKARINAFSAKQLSSCFRDHRVSVRHPGQSPMTHRYMCPILARMSGIWRLVKENAGATSGTNHGRAVADMRAAGKKRLWIWEYETAAPVPAGEAGGDGTR